MECQNSRYGVLVLNLTIATAGIMVGYAFSCLNPVVPVLHRIYNQTYFRRNGESIPENAWTALLSITMSMPFIGGFFGALLLKPLLSRMTRKQVIMTLHVTNIAGYAIIAIGGGIWGSYEAFIIGRFVIGLAIGVGEGIFPVVVSEICVPHRRPFFSGLLGTLYTCGALCGAVIGWPKVFGTDERWLGIIFFGMLPSLVYLACAYWITITPFQAMVKEGPAVALQVLRKLRSGKEVRPVCATIQQKSKKGQRPNSYFQSEIETEVMGLADEKEGGVTNSTTEATLREIFQTPHYRRHFIAMVILFSYVTACGMSNIMFFSDNIFANAGLGPEARTPASIGVFAIGSVVCIAGVFALRRIDPRTLILIASLLMIFGDAFLTASIATYEKVPVMSIWSVVAMCIYFFGFNIVNVTTLVLMAEISIDRTRTSGMHIGAMGFWFFGWFVGFISPYFQVWIGPYAFLVWMVITIGVALYILFFVPDTRGKTEKQIQDFFKGKKK